MSILSIVSVQIFTQNIFYDQHESNKSVIIIINDDKDILVSNEWFCKRFMVIYIKPVPQSETEVKSDCAK